MNNSIREKGVLSLKKAAIVGGTGYGAVELVRLLQSHPKIEIRKIISHSQYGNSIDEAYPHLSRVFEVTMEEWNAEELKNEIDIVFFAAPAGVAKELIPELQDSPIQCVDLSGDLRLKSAEDYEAWYGIKAAPNATLQQAVYGLTEVFKEDIKHAKIISNPGCFPTAALLGTVPAIVHNLIQPYPIIIDGKTGVSGAGRKQSAMTHFSETNENVTAYKVGHHQHIPEIDQYLSQAGNQPITTVFTTHLVPMTRGLVCTIYGSLNRNADTAEIISLYRNFYEGHPFVRIRDEGHFPTTKEVYGSNFCDIGIHADARTNQLIIVSAIDNLVKGAAGQAIQNVNVMNGWDESLGLEDFPVYP